MTKKNFVSLGSAIKAHNKRASTAYGRIVPFLDCHIKTLVEWQREQSVKFKESRWTDFVGGRCGPNGGRIKR